MVTLLSQYQKLSERTLNSASPHKAQVTNYTLGLAGETGEVVDILKKVLFHGHKLDVDKLSYELGDVLFYLTAIATMHNISLADIATMNVRKLRARYPNGFSEKASRERTDN